MMYMKVGESAKFVSFESLPEKFREYYNVMYIRAKPEEYDSFMYSFLKYKRAHDNEFKNMTPVEQMIKYADERGWYFLENVNSCIPLDTLFKGDPFGLLAKYEYYFDLDYVIVTRVK